MKKIFSILITGLLVIGSCFAYESKYIEYSETMKVEENEFWGTSRPLDVVCYKTKDQLKENFPNYIFEKTHLFNVLDFLLYDNSCYCGKEEVTFSSIKNLLSKYNYIGLYADKSVLNKNFYNNLLKNTPEGVSGLIILIEKASDTSAYTYMAIVY